MGEAAAVSGESGVRVLAVSRVAPSPAPAAPERVALSFFDAPWVVLPPIQRVFLYETAPPHAVERLKRSLAATLALYLPLAGRLTYVADTGDVVVDCDAGDDNTGVAFVEAEADGSFDVRRLAGDEAHDVAAFVALVPELDARVLPAPVLAVQTTRLGGVGIALGVSVLHAVADGRAVWGFMEAWSSAARVGSPVTKLLGPTHYGRAAAIPHPADGSERARHMLKLVAPNLPVASSQHDFSRRFRLDRRTFHLDADAIHSLKRRIDAAIAAAAAGETPAKPVSTFVALAAIGWMAFVRAKSLAAGEDTYLAFLADMRARLDLPVADGYLGNCVKICLARCADAAELAAGAGELALVAAARAVQAAVAEMEAAPATDGMDGSAVARMMRLPYHRLANVAASPRFRAYDAADFGFGRPARVELVSMNHDGEMVLVGGRRDGEVQLSVSIDPAHVDAFKAQVLG